MRRLHPRILIVEDDEVIRRLLITALSRESLTVETAADGAEALEKIREGDYALILIDLMLPRMSGFELLDAARYLFRRPRPVIFIMTAFEAATVRALDPTLVDAVFRKPFDVFTIADIVRECAIGWGSWVDRERQETGTQPSMG